MKLRLVAPLLALLPLVGCSAAAWKDRGHDFVQILDATLSFGPGIAASARVTELAQIGAGSFDGQSVGLIDGRPAVAREQRSELGVTLLHTYEYRRNSSQLLDVRHPLFGDPGFTDYPLSWQMESDRHDADVGFNLHIAYVGGGAALHLDELWDFVAGCFGLDPLHDDAYSRSIDELKKQALSRDAALRDRAFDALDRRGEPIHGYAIYTAPDARPSYQRRAMDAMQQ